MTGLRSTCVCLLAVTASFPAIAQLQLPDSLQGNPLDGKMIDETSTATEWMQPIHFLSFDGSIVDEITGVAGTPSGGVTHTKGYLGNAIFLDGSGLVELPIDVSPSAIPELTIVAMVKPAPLPDDPEENPPNIGYIVSDSDGLLILSNQTKPEPRFEAYSTGAAISSSVHTGVRDGWQMVAITRTVELRTTDEGEKKPHTIIKLFTNGRISEAAGIRKEPAIGPKIVLGMKAPDHPYRFRGSIDHLSIYQRALSADELNDLMTRMRQARTSGRRDLMVAGANAGTAGAGPEGRLTPAGTVQQLPDGTFDADEQQFPGDMFDGDERVFPGDMFEGDEEQFPGDMFERDRRQQVVAESFEGEAIQLPSDKFNADEQQFPDDMFEGDENLFPGDMFEEGDEEQFPGDMFEDGDDASSQDSSATQEGPRSAATTSLAVADGVHESTAVLDQRTDADPRAGTTVAGSSSPSFQAPVDTADETQELIGSEEGQVMLQTADWRIEGMVPNSQDKSPLFPGDEVTVKIRIAKDDPANKIPSVRLVTNVGPGVPSPSYDLMINTVQAKPTDERDVPITLPIPETLRFEEGATQLVWRPKVWLNAPDGLPLRDAIAGNHNRELAIIVTKGLQTVEDCGDVVANPDGSRTAGSCLKKSPSPPAPNFPDDVEVNLRVDLSNTHETELSGYGELGIADALILASGYPLGFIKTSEQADRPCRISIDDSFQLAGDGGLKADRCKGSEGDHREFRTKGRSGITALRVCHSRFNADRVKSIEVLVHSILPDGSLGIERRAVQTQPAGHCGNRWREWVSCPAGQIAGGITASFVRRSGSDELRGVGLICGDVVVVGGV